MKTKTNFLVIFAVIIATNIFSVSSQTTSDFFFDKKYENGKVVSSTRYELEYSGLHVKKYLCEYSYDESGNLVKKESFKWDSKGFVWTPVYYIQYFYNRIDNHLEASEYASWNKKENKFNEVSEKALYQTDYVGDILFYQFIKIDGKGNENLTIQWSKEIKYLAM
jgi:hypothetical protein